MPDQAPAIPHQGAAKQRDAISTARGSGPARAARYASLAGGGALALYGLSRRTPLGYGLALAGGGLVYRGATAGPNMLGRSPVASVPHGQGIKVVQVMTINKPAGELYRFWRDFENLPRFMKHLQAVRVQDERRSHWVVKGPAGRDVEWDAEIINEEEGRLIGWRSLEGADIANAGSVRFTPAPAGRGTEVKVTLEYNPPAGALGAAFAKVFGEEPGQQTAEDLKRFKQIMETGELATTHGQPAGAGRKKD